jgi:hypothetical protein
MLSVVLMHQSIRRLHHDATFSACEIACFLEVKKSPELGSGFLREVAEDQVGAGTFD